MEFQNRKFVPRRLPGGATPTTGGRRAASTWGAGARAIPSLRRKKFRLQKRLFSNVNLLFLCQHTICCRWSLSSQHCCSTPRTAEMINNTCFQRSSTVGLFESLVQSAVVVINSTKQEPHPTLTPNTSHHLISYLCSGQDINNSPSSCENENPYT